MESAPHSTLQAADAAQSLRAGKTGRGNWIAVVLEALYQLQRRQAMKVIRLYPRFVAGRDDRAQLRLAAEDRHDPDR